MCMYLNVNISIYKYTQMILLSLLQCMPASSTVVRYYTQVKSPGSSTPYCTCIRNHCFGCNYNINGSFERMHLEVRCF